MEFPDERIIELRQKEKEKAYTTLETGIYVNRELIEFASEKLFNEQMEIFIANIFLLICLRRLLR